MPEFFWRALSFHAPGSGLDPDDRWGQQGAAIGALALTLARYDRDLALALLGTAAVVRPETAYQAVNLFRAAALADPPRAVKMFAALPAGQNSDWVRDAVVATLLADGDGVDRVMHHALAQSPMDDEDP